MINMNKMNNKKKWRIRTVAVNERGQIVIPEDIRKDMGIEGTDTLVIIEKEGEIVIKKESEVLAALGEDAFWKALARESMGRAWGKEDELWDKIAKKEGLR